MKAPMMTKNVATSLLANKVFNIEFNGYLTNHAKHAVIALERLGAPDSRIQQYWNEYTGLTPYSLQLDKVPLDWDTEVKPATLEQWNDWRGKKIHWQEQVAFMNQELVRLDNNTTQLVKAYAPDILSGMPGALTHGIIHLGWAIDAASPWMITEGLAYLNFCHLGFDAETAATIQPNKHSEFDPMDSYTRVAKTFRQENLQETWVDRVKAAYDETFHQELVPAGFQWHLAKAIQEPHAVATELPTWLQEQPLTHVWESLYRAIAYIYLGTRSSSGNGNFVILHLVTSLWGLEQTLRVLDLAEEEERTVLSQFYAMSVILLSMGSGGFPSANLLEQAQKDFPSDAVDNPKTFSWDDTVKAGIAETEEHNPKLVYVARELWLRYGYWKGFSASANAFTLTPQLGGGPGVAFSAD